MSNPELDAELAKNNVEFAAKQIDPAKHPKLLELEPKLAALEQALLAQDPKMPVHLKEIHKYLIQFEELSHLLTEDQIAIILDGQQRQVGIKLAVETAKAAKSSSSAKLKKLTADDL